MVPRLSSLLPPGTPHDEKPAYFPHCEASVPEWSAIRRPTISGLLAHPVLCFNFRVARDPRTRDVVNAPALRFLAISLIRATQARAILRIDSNRRSEQRRVNTFWRRKILQDYMPDTAQ